ncbi:hypothetical protein ACTA71_011478 [Dictyostelium dimigraforme]
MKDITSTLFPINEEDKEKLNYAIYKCGCGELYRFIGSKKEYPIDEIARIFKEVKSHFNENDKEGKSTIQSLDAAYAVISDKRLRNYYDQELYDEVVKDEKEYFDSVNKKKHSLLSIIGFLSTPFEIAKLVINASQSQSSSFQILQSFVKSRSVLQLCKISSLQAIYPSVMAAAIIPLFVLKDRFLGYSFSKIGKLTDEILWISSSFCFTFPLECYILASNHLSFFNVIKKVVLCQDIETGKFNFRNLASTFLHVLSMYAINRVYKIGVDTLEAYVESKSLENPNSTFWRNASIIKSTYVKSLLLSLFLVPYHTILSQYPYLYIQRYLGNPTRLISTNPISLAVHLVKTQGFGKLYKSLPFAYVAISFNEYLCDTLNKKQMNVNCQ